MLRRANRWTLLSWKWAAGKYCQHERTVHVVLGIMYRERAVIVAVSRQGEQDPKTKFLSAIKTCLLFFILLIKQLLTAEIKTGFDSRFLTHTDINFVTFSTKKVPHPHIRRVGTASAMIHINLNISSASQVRYDQWDQTNQCSTWLRSYLITFSHWTFSFHVTTLQWEGDKLWHISMQNIFKSLMPIIEMLKKKVSTFNRFSMSVRFSA